MSRRKMMISDFPLRQVVQFKFTINQVANIQMRRDRGIFSSVSRRQFEQAVTLACPMFIAAHFPNPNFHQFHSDFLKGESSFGFSPQLISNLYDSVGRSPAQSPWGISLSRD